MELKNKNEDPSKNLFLKVSIEVYHRKFITELLNKRDFSSFYINCMSYLDINIPSKMLHIYLKRYIYIHTHTHTHTHTTHTHTHTHTHTYMYIYIYIYYTYIYYMYFSLAFFCITVVAAVVAFFK